MKKEGDKKINFFEGGNKKKYILREVLLTLRWELSRIVAYLSLFCAWDKPFHKNLKVIFPNVANKNSGYFEKVFEHQNTLFEKKR